MRVKAGGVRLYVEVSGKKLSTEGGTVSERPTIIFLHGGPAWDHLTLLPDFEPLNEFAQLVFYDHRGLGRSDIASPATWTLKQWASDLMVLIDTLGIEKPVVLGQSFGGMVAQQFAIDYPGAYSGLILSATAARFDLESVVESFRASGGDASAELARAFFTSASPAARDAFIADVLPTYTRTRRDIGALSPYIPDVTDHFFSDAGDGRKFDFRGDLSRVRAPTLVIGGDADPVITPSAVRELAAAFAPGVASCTIFENCGHGPARDRPEETIDLLRSFVDSLAGRVHA